MPRFLRISFTGISFFVFSAFGAIVSYIILPLTALVVWRPEARRETAQRTIHHCAQIYVWSMRLMSLFRFHAPKTLPEPIASGKPAVIVANHPALLDIMWLMSIFPKVTYLAKAEWFRSPLIAPLLRFGGQIPGPADADPLAGAKVLEAMLDRLERGYPVVIFPEGTRSPPGGLRNYHKGAFEAAMRAGVPLVCMKIDIDPPTLFKGQKWYEVPDRTPDVRIDVLEVIQPEAFPKSARALRKHVHARYALALGVETPAKTLATAAPPAPTPT